MHVTLTSSFFFIANFLTNDSIILLDSVLSLACTVRGLRTTRVDGTPRSDQYLVTTEVNDG